MSDVAYILDPKGNRIAMMDGFGNLSEEAALLYAQDALKAEDKARIDALAAEDALTRDALDGLMLLQSGRRTAIAALKQDVVGRTGAQLLSSSASGSSLQWLRIAAGIALLITVGIGTYFVAQYVQKQQMAATLPKTEPTPPAEATTPVAPPQAAPAVVDSSLLVTDAAVAEEANTITAPATTASAPPQPVPAEVAAKNQLAVEQKMLALQADAKAKEAKTIEAKAKEAQEKKAKDAQAELQRKQAQAEMDRMGAARGAAAQQKGESAGAAMTDSDLADSEVEVKVMPSPTAQRAEADLKAEKRSRKKEEPETAAPATASRNAAKREAEASEMMEQSVAKQSERVATTNPTDKPVAYDEVQSPPRFPGGDLEMFRFINRNKSYPEELKKNGVSGNVFVNFIVEKDGRISNINVTKGVNTELDADAKRVLQSMPKWNAAEQDGQPVRSTRTLVIKYE